jgi:glycosyltransferase involved in cell wall biosynthesis
MLFGMSDHEGLCVPPLEAMSLGLPVVIKSAGAVPETVGDGALLMPEGTKPALAAEYVERVWTSQALRDELINAGRRRVSEFESEITVDGLITDIVQAVR